MCSRRARTRSARAGARAGSAPSAAITTWRARTLAGAGHDRPVAERGADLGALVDARPRGLGRARQRADPAGRVQRAVVVGEAAVVEAGAQRRRQGVALDQLGGEAVGAQGVDLPADVLGLLLGCRDSQEAGAPHRLGGAQLRGELVDLLLRRKRAPSRARARGRRRSARARRRRTRPVRPAGSRRCGRSRRPRRCRARARPSPPRARPAPARTRARRRRRRSRMPRPPRRR